ncbi:MAG: radical SAM protein [Proteobacteria bacterium]|nr:radical SAM protein [Desulfobacula sp.]MBU4130434.1 radical SAM protein [Pseudomonadota bacterium]
MSDRFRIDSHKLMFHPTRVSQWLGAGNDWEKLKKIYPIYMELSPSGVCNHRCSFCAFDYIGYQKRFLSLGRLQQIIPEIAGLGVKSILCSGEGEPLLNQDIIPITKLIRGSGIDVAFASNATLMDKKFTERSLHHITWFKASIAAGTKENYAKIHHTRESDFGTVIQNLKYAVYWKNKHKINCTLGAQILLLPENAGEVETLAKICRDDIGLDYLVVKPYSQHGLSATDRYGELDYHLFDKEKLINSDLSSERFSFIWRESTMEKTSQKRQYDFCRAIPFLYAHITAMGDVYGCSSFLGKEKFCYGNINESNFQEIWEGEKRRQNYEYIKNVMDCSKCRINCRMDEINSYLYDLHHPGAHVNFI